MNKEQIIELAKQACDKYKADAWHNGFWTITQEELERFAQLIRNQTLESAAKICDKHKFNTGVLMSSPSQSLAAKEISISIRSMKEAK